MASRFSVELALFIAGRASYASSFAAFRAKPKHEVLDEKPLSICDPGHPRRRGSLPCHRRARHAEISVNDVRLPNLRRNGRRVRRRKTLIHAHALPTPDTARAGSKA